jgi:hypothetical protein
VRLDEKKERENDQKNRNIGLEYIFDFVGRSLIRGHPLSPRLRLGTPAIFGANIR